MSEHHIGAVEYERDIASLLDKSEERILRGAIISLDLLKASRKYMPKLKGLLANSRDGTLTRSIMRSLGRAGAMDCAGDVAHFP